MVASVKRTLRNTDCFMYSDGNIVIVKSVHQSGSGNGVMEDDAKCKLISFDNPHVRVSYSLGTPTSTFYRNRVVTGLMEGDWIVEHSYRGLTQYFKILGEHIIGRGDLITNKPIKKHIFNINSPWG
jgi:hypothetical protein